MNIADRFDRSAQRLSDKAALLFRDRVISYGELAEMTGRAAAAFQDLGLERGDRVALMLGNTPAFVEAFFGALKAGLVVVPLNAGYQSPEIAHILRDSGARVLVVAEPLVPVVEAAEITPEHVVVVGTSDRHASWSVLLDDPGEQTLVAVGDEDLALLQYTSGTTGRPKGAMLTHANLLANHEQLEQTKLQIAERDVVLCALPLFHIYALNVALAFTLSKGATLRLVERFDPLQTLQDIATHRVSVILGAPPMYVAWLNTPGVDAMDLDSVRFAVSGAAPLPGHVLERFRDELGISIWEGYGLTETSPVLTTVAMGEELRPGSVGRPLPGVELRLVDVDGAPVRRGDPGEVVARGPNVFTGYWQQPEATAEVLDPDGWFHTGDVGYAADGYLYLVDRRTDLILVSGFNVYPREVEDVLYAHPKVAEAAVVGVPHPDTGETVKAVIVLRPPADATAEEIIEFCRARLVRFKCPEVVEFTDSLPHLPSGKVLRRALRAADGAADDQSGAVDQPA